MCRTTKPIRRHTAGLPVVLIKLVLAFTHCVQELKQPMFYIKIKKNKTYQKKPLSFINIDIHLNHEI